MATIKKKELLKLQLLTGSFQKAVRFLNDTFEVAVGNSATSAGKGTMQLSFEWQALAGFPHPSAQITLNHDPLSLTLSQST